MQQRATMRLAALGLAVALTGTACAGPNGSTTAGSAAGADGDTITIGFSQRRLAGSDWWATLLKGAKDKAAEMGAKVIVTDASGDTVKQNSDVQTLLTKGADVIILNPQDPTGVAPAVALIIEGPDDRRDVRLEKTVADRDQRQVDEHDRQR